MVQEAFCRALAKWPRISQYDDPVAWVRKVAWNLATSRWRRVRSNLHFVLRQRLEHTPGPDPAEVDLQAALNRLPPRQRQAVVLHYLSDVPVAEIARIMGVAEGTVKSWLHRARTTLDARLRLGELPPTRYRPRVAPPGVDAASRTIRRRRDRNTLLGIVILVCLAIAAFVLPSRLFKEPTIKPTPSLSPSTATQPTPAAPAEKPAATDPPITATSPACVAYPVAVALNHLPADDARVGFKDPVRTSPDPSQVMCPGVRLKISWAAYSVDGRGNFTLVYSGSVYLDNQNRQRTFHVQLPSGCRAYFVTATDVPVPEVFTTSSISSKNVGGPFWDERLNGRSLIRQDSGGVCPADSPTPTP